MLFWNFLCRIVQFAPVILTLSKVSCYIHLKRRWNQFLLIQKSILHWRLYNLLYFLVSTVGWVLLVRFLLSSSVLFFITMAVIWSSEFRFDFSHVAVSDSWTILHEVVGTVEGGRAPTKIKTDLKKPIVNLACHPRLPVLVRCLFAHDSFPYLCWSTLCYGLSEIMHIWFSKNFI